MCLQRKMRYLTQRLYDGSAERNVRHKVSIHHIYVDAAGSGQLCLSDLLTESSKVSSKDRWSQLDCAFCNFRVILLWFQERRFHDVFEEYNRFKTLSAFPALPGADNIWLVRRQRQLPPVLPGRFIDLLSWSTQVLDASKML